MTKLNIALIAPPLLQTPPRGYGGLERVVYDLGCALVKGGDSVTLFAPNGSHIDGGKTVETGIAPERTDVNWVECEGNSYNVYAKDLGNFDITHDHTWFYFAALKRIGNPEVKMLHTHHGHLSWDINKLIKEVCPVNLVGISDFMRKEYESQSWSSRYVYNGIDLDSYPLSTKERDGLVYVGRISKFKNPDVAIRAAIESKQHINVIGGSFVDDVNYLTDITKMCGNSGGYATLHLDLPHKEKVEMVQKAKACLVPSAFSEPYGLVATESMAMGTPVIAYNDGALKEVIGTSPLDRGGYICDDYISFLYNVKWMNKDESPSPQMCRKRAEMFSREKMAENYRKLYVEILEGGGW